MKQWMSSLLLIAIVLIVLMSGCLEQDEQKALQEVKIQAMWVPNAQFAGYYMAMEKGYYEEEGLSVVFNEYDETIAVKDTVAGENADFGIDGANQVIVGRSEGLPLKALMVNFRKSPTAFASLIETGIEKLGDLDGKKIGYLPDDTFVIFKTMIRINGINESTMTFIEYGYNFEMLYNGTVDVIPIYIFDEPYIMGEEGYDINTLLAYDYGVHFYGDTLFTTDQMIEENPGLVEGFIRATLRGWQYAIENPAEAVDIVLLYDHEDYHDKDYETYIINHESPLVHTGEDYIGWMKESVWQEMHDLLLDQGMLEKSINVSECYTMEFLEKIYETS